MIGFQLETSFPNWPDVVPHFPAGCPIMSIGNMSALPEAKAKNSGVATVYRHYVSESQQNAWLSAGTEAEMLANVRTFFGAFWGDLLRYAASVDYIVGLNEYTTNAHVPPAQREWMRAQGFDPGNAVFDEHGYNQRLLWLRTLCSEWTRLKAEHGELAYIKLVTVNAAPGNSIPLAYAQVTHAHGNVLGHHPYVAITDGEIRADDGKYYSGRWRTDDEYFRAQGVEVLWFGSEAGPMLADAAGNLDSHAGYKVCLAGATDRYIAVMQYNRDMLEAWNAANRNRHRGVALFVAGARPGWASFDLGHDRLILIATHAATAVPDVIPPATRAPGIDVSHWQGDIDWDAVAAAGVQFAVCKLSESDYYIDTQAGANIDGMADAGLLGGVYHYWRAEPDQDAQAAFFADLVAEHVPDGFMLVVDAEDTNAAGNVADSLHRFLQRVEALTGTRPLIYTGAWWWNYRVGDAAWAADYPLWVAHYGVDAPRLPLGWDAWDIWQYTSEGSVAGINPVDENWFDGDADELRAFWQAHGWHKPAPTGNGTYYRVTAEPHLNIRLGPGIDAEDVGDLQPGTIVRAVGEAVDGYMPVELWAAKAWLELVEQVEAFAFRAWPTDYLYVTQGFGANPQNYQQFGLPGHEGIDVRAPYGTPVYAVADGTVIEVDAVDDSAYGKHVTIQHPEGYRTLYAHLSRIDVALNQVVSAGEQIAAAGSTGNSTAAHLHLTLYGPDPAPGYPHSIMDPSPFAEPFEPGGYL